MIENYVDSVEVIELYVYDDGQRVSADSTPTAVAVDAETEAAVTLSPVQSVDSGNGYNFYQVNITPDELTYTRQVMLTWEYIYAGTTYNRTEVVNVVRPYFDVDDLWIAYPDLAAGGANAMSLDEVKRLEKIVRKRINRHCNQTFQDYGQKIVHHRGTGTNTLQLSRRLYKLEEVKHNDFVLFDRNLDGSVNTEIVTWMPEEPNIITKKYDGYYPTLDEEQNLVPHLSPTRSLFRNNRIYAVDALWGWRNVPSNVTEAALLMAFDYTDPSDQYRQKNVAVARSADWRLEFGRSHHTTTGNVDADDLLSEYREEGVFVF